VFDTVFPALAWAGLAACVLKNSLAPLMDYDLWWQLACGRDMVSQRLFLRSETFSHTLYGAPWINFEWLSQIGLYVLYKAGGLTLVWIVKVALCVGVVALITVLLVRARLRGPALWLVVGLSYFALNSRLYDRVELISLVFFPLLLNILASLRTRALFSSEKTLWIVGAMMVLWVNLHGGFLYGLALIGAFCIGARWSGQNARVIGAIDRSFVCALVATLINPFGPYLMTVFVDHGVQMTAGVSLIQEWRAPTVSQTPFFWVIFIAALTALAVGFWKKPESVKFWAVALFVFGLWGTHSLRNTVYMAELIPFFIADLLWVSADNPGGLARKSNRRFFWALALGLFIFVGKKEFGKPWFRGIVQAGRFPFGACDFIQKNGLDGTLYNTYHFGGAIEWALGHSLPVFFDGRYLFQPLLVAQNRLDQAILADPSPEGWQRFLARYDVDIAISEYGPFETIPARGRAPFPLASANLMFPRSAWALVYWDDTALVFLKRGPRFDAAIRKWEYVCAWPYNFAQMQLLLQTKKIDANALREELKRNALDAPHSYMRQRIENLLAATHVD
jgi:hypothetical protein